MTQKPKTKTGLGLKRLYYFLLNTYGKDKAFTSLQGKAAYKAVPEVKSNALLSFLTHYGAVQKTKRNTYKVSDIPDNISWDSVYRIAVKRMRLIRFEIRENKKAINAAKNKPSKQTNGTPNNGILTFENCCEYLKKHHNCVIYKRVEKLEEV